MKKLNKLIVAALSVFSLFFSISICASAAQIDMLSMIDNTIYASTSGEELTFFAAEYSDGLLVDVFFKDSSAGYVELEVGNATEYKVFLWDRTSLAPVSCTYKLVDGVAYTSEGEKVPPYESTSYTFNQEDNVTVVSSISESELKGFKAGAEVTYPLAGNVTVLGLSNNIEDVVPGSVVLIATDQAGRCNAIELLASLGIPVNPENFEKSYGVHYPSDGSEKYRNIVTDMYSKSGSKLCTYILDEEGNKTYYSFESNASMCYRIGIAMDGSVPVITCTGNKISAYPSIFEKTTYYHNYLYLRYNAQTDRVKECVFYCVPKDFDPTKGDGEYSDIFSAGPIIIIK
ncbi:MAG: hypothetical protein ACI3XA_00520 [Clostridia bacterium]